MLLLLHPLAFLGLRSAPFVLMLAQLACSLIPRHRLALQHAPPPRRGPAVCACAEECVVKFGECATAVELQSDCGRGVAHLSFRLEEGDVCVYQVGTWHVDWSEVGSGAPPRLLLVRVDCLQLNWTHDHEHGLITATAINEVDGSVVRVDEDEPYGAVTFAPEQLVARVPATWADDFVGTLLAPLPSRLPASLAVEEEVLLPVQTGRFEGPGLG